MRKIALLVGIDEYADPSIPDLDFCKADAIDMATILKMDEFGFETHLLLDDQATAREIRLASHRLRDEVPELFLLFFAGHGETIRNSSYLVTHDAIEGDPGIESSALSTMIEIDSGISVAILDCCYSGGAIPWRGREPRNADLLFRDIRSAKGQALIAACRPDELASETATDGHGKLTNLLLNGMTGGAIDGHGEVTFSGLWNYVHRGLSDDARQGPVVKQQTDDRIIIGSGMEPGPAIEDVESEVRATIVSARSRLDNIHRYLASDLSRWKETGWQHAAQAVTDLDLWRRSKEQALPELRKSKEFRENVSAPLLGFRAQLAALSDGLDTGRGTVVGAVGSGAFGAVYKIQTDDGRLLAYKVYNAADLSDLAKIDRFKRGFRAMERLDHPNIVRVHEFTEAPLGFTMDYIPGPNLRSAQGGLGPGSIKLGLYKQILQAVNAAHHASVPVLHRDIKPENVIVGYLRNGEIDRLYLTDFDLAWFSTATTSIVPEGGMGTIWYAAPEQLQSPDARKSRRETVDVYGLGQLMFFMLTGRDPTSPDPSSNADVLHRALESGIDYALGAGHLVDLYREATSFKPSERMSTSDEFVERFDEIILAFVDLSDAEIVPSETFLGEVASVSVGWSDRVTGWSDDALQAESASRRVYLSVRDSPVGKNIFRLRARLAPTQRLSVPEAPSYDVARTTVNRRLDKRLSRARLPRDIVVTRRRGYDANYETFIEFTPVHRTMADARVCGETLSSVVSLLDQYCE